MLVDKIKLNAITTGTNLKTFNIDIGGTSYTYFGDIETTDSLNDDQECNKYCAYNLYNNHIIHNLYRFDRVGIQSSTRFQHVTDTLEDYIRIFIPDFTKDQIIKTCQNESFTYILTKPTTQGFKFDYFFDNDGQMSTRLSTEDIYTYLYNPLSGNYESYQDMLSDGITNLSTVFNQTFNIKNIRYNYIIEIPNEYVYNYYDDGIILGDGINTKNHLAYDYTMHMKSNIADSSFSISAIQHTVLFDDSIQQKAFSIQKNAIRNSYDIECDYAIYRTIDFNNYEQIQPLVEDTENIVRICDDSTGQYTALNIDNSFNVTGITPINGKLYACAKTSDGKFHVLSSNSITSQFTDIPSLSTVARIFNCNGIIFIEDTRIDNNSNVYYSPESSSIDISEYKTWQMVNFGTYEFKDYIHAIKRLNNNIICFFDRDVFLFDIAKITFTPLIVVDDKKITNTIEDIIYVDELKCYVAFGQGYTLIDKQSNSSYIKDYIRFSFDLQKWINVDYNFMSTKIVYCYYTPTTELLHFINQDLTEFTITKFNITKWNSDAENNLVIYFGKNRNYIDIDKRGDTMYLKYTTLTNYEVNSIVLNEIEMPINRSLDNYASYKEGIADVKNLIARDAYIEPTYIDMYQKVEVIKSINRFKQVQHKSNLYAIQIDDSGVNTQVNQTYRQLIKDDIENNIRDIIKSVAPANTQFLNIKWTGK